MKSAGNGLLKIGDIGSCSDLYLNDPCFARIRRPPGVALVGRKLGLSAYRACSGLLRCTALAGLKL